MNLNSQRLMLKEITWDELELVHELNSFPESDQYNTLGIPNDLNDTRQTLAPGIEDQTNANRTKYVWGIWFGEEFVGKVGMNVLAEKYRRAEIYYILNPGYWGKGIATEAAQAVLAFGFEILHLHRIEAGVATENVASIRVLEKLGMTREGIGRKILPIRGEWVDNFSYSILEDDPRDY